MNDIRSVSIDNRNRVMKKNLFLLLLLCVAMACSKSGSDDSSDSGTSMEMMNEQSNNPEDESAGIIMGEFMNGAHPTSGLVTVNEQRTELVIKDFKSDDGPILELYIANDIQATEYTSLGVLQGLEGDFSYEVPGGIDFETHNYVLVWCVEFSVSFGHAILE